MSKKIKKGDKVIVNSGSQKGKIGTITKISEKYVEINGVSKLKKHKKPSSSSRGIITEIERKIHYSNISRHDK